MRLKVKKMLRECKTLISRQDFVCPFMKHTRIAMNQDKSKIIIQCCVCKKIRQGDHWVMPPHLLHSLADSISHGFCPLCYTAELSKVDKWIAEEEEKKKAKKLKKMKKSTKRKKKKS